MTGSSNPAVSNLQAALTQAGIPLTKDGRFGPRTEAAVKRLQTQYGLTADGVVGPATKALLLGLASKTTTTAKAKTGTGAAPLLPGEVATLRTKPPSPRHGSRTAGSRMKLKGPAGKPAILKYSASDLPDPDLEEDTSVGGNGVPNTSTVAFGVGGQPSMSIKDARPAPEPTPAADLPIWDRLQRIANPPNRSIPDGRDVVPQTGVQTGRALIDDGRDQTVDVMALLQEAIAERKAATDGRTFARALARERVLRERLQESLGHSVSKAVRGYFDPYDTLPQPRRSGVPHPFSEVEHPRGRGGKWVDVLAKLKGLKPNKPSEVDGIKAMRLTNGYYTAALPGGHVISESAEHVADAIVSQLEERTFSAAEREKLATKGHAMPHGGFPIENAKDLANAIQALGRAKNPQAAKAHIIAQAKRLKLTASLPDSWNLQESAKTAALAATPSPFSTSKTSNWVARVGGLPSYIQNVAKGIMKSGKSESEAISAAIGICKRWAAGGGGVHPEVKAAAAAAIAEWERKKAQSHAKSAAKK
jgi:peptidoglycan hydrolase-like protein with peptidoglycan-binding domain